MPILGLPSDDTNDEPVVHETLLSKAQYDYIVEFFSKVSWKCPQCELTNHHNNAKCANWRCNATNPFKTMEKTND